MSEVSRPDNNARFIRPINANGYAIVGLDLTLDINGNLRLIEANGSNQGATSLGHANGDLHRAGHQVEAAMPLINAEDYGAVLVAYADGTGLVAEIMTRLRWYVSI